MREHKAEKRGKEGSIRFKMPLLINSSTRPHTVFEMSTWIPVFPDSMNK